MDIQMKIKHRTQNTEHRLIHRFSLSVKRSVSVTVIILSALVVFLPSCRQNGWMDWKVENELWLTQNKTNPEIKVTASGLQYKIIADPLASSNDARPNTTSTIYCDYTVKLINGNTIDQGHYAAISLASAIPGFTEGCRLIHNQGDIELYIPAYLGYDYDKYNSGSYYEAEGTGTEGTTAYIPPYSTLIFTVHICGISEN